ncbi:MAG TPA: hypothetical protein VKB34_19710, partial [Povalibacter sp.]|nr:hypothetical protein [Povalibacter sp.]
VAPLAASRAPVDFVIVSFGLAIGPLDEDREEVFQELRSKGCGEPVLSEARELTLITRRVLLSRFTTGLEDLRRFKAAHAQEPWLKEVEGDFTGPMVQTPEDQFGKLIEALSFDAILDYDARATLERVRTPMLWVVAGQDTEAPSAPTLEVLRALQPDPGQLDIAVFPRADHGMIDMEMRDGKRRAMGHSPGYFDLLAHWIAERSLEGTFGAAQLQPDATNGRL